MGLLDVLDQYEFKKGDSYEVEYRLVSWGEIYPPFLGDREHSLAARFILQDFPFKLFSVSILYSEIPQKLCLTFHSPAIQTESGNISAVDYDSDDTAKEFSAFLSLVTRRRIFPVALTREDGWPVEQPASVYQKSHSQERQFIKEIDPSEIHRLLRNLQAMDRAVATRLILSLRLYHSGVEMMFSEPEFAYLFFVTSIEAISSAVYRDLWPDETAVENYLDSAFQGWRNLCDVSTPDKRKQVENMLLSTAFRVQYKFRKFIIENLSEKFWTETEDDAKPNHPYSVIYPSLAENRAIRELKDSDRTIRPREQMPKSDLVKTLDRIYAARSKFVHEGARFPPDIVRGHFKFLSAKESLAMLMRDNPGSAVGLLDVPPLLTFERLVSYALVEFIGRVSVP